MSAPQPRPFPRFGARRRGLARREPLPPAPPTSTAGARRWAMPRPLGGPGLWLAASLAVHVLLAVGLILWPDARPRAPAQLPPPSFDIVFDGASPERAGGEAPPGEEAPPSPPPAAPPSVSSPPTPAAPTSPVPSPPAPAPAPPPPPPLPPPDARPAPAPAAPPITAEAPRPLAPPPPAPPLRAQAPALPAPPPRPPSPEAPPATQALPLPEAEEFLAPPTELRLPQRLAQSLPPTPAQPAPRPAPQPAPQRLPGIFLPDGAQLGSPGGAARPPSGRPQGRGLDLSVDPRFAEGDARTDPSVRVQGAQVGANWRAAFRRWLDQNISYPEQAALRGEDGTVRVQIVANPDGSVRSVRLVLPSTSPSLNYATTFPFQGAQLPAFPPPADPGGVTVDLTVNYILRRR